MSNISDVICGAGTFFTTLGVVSNMPEGTNPWINLVVAIISALVFGFVNIGGKILTSYLEKKGIISHKDREEIDDKLDDLADDGKLNDSNSEKDNLDK